VAFFPVLCNGSTHLLCVDSDWLVPFRPPVEILFLEFVVAKGKRRPFIY